MKKIKSLLHLATFSAMIMVTALVGECIADTRQKRNRGENFDRCINSNTVGPGNIWVSCMGVGHIWDDAPITSDTDEVNGGGALSSNVRAFPEFNVHLGLINSAMITVATRPLSWGWKPGHVAGAIKATIPDNKALRLNGLGMQLKYIYQFSDGPPTLGGYRGFMPEGYVVKGHASELQLIYELDCIAWKSWLPLRFLTNMGVRMPFDPAYRDTYQYIGDIAVVYNGFAHDFFLAFSLEAFKNFLEPKEFRQANTKRFLVFFPENLMYVTLGGNIRYSDGIALSITVPLLVSQNIESKMTPKDLSDLNQLNSDRFPEEVGRGIRDPFDPWFVKWKVKCAISFPIRFKMTSAEMIRNFLLLKNQKQDKHINIDSRIKEHTNQDSTDSSDGGKKGDH